MNPHRGDTTVVVGGGEYTICYDLNAVAKVMERMGIQKLESLADLEALNSAGVSDLIYIIWCGFNRHHPEMTVEEVGGLEWDLAEVNNWLGDAFNRGLTRKTVPDVEGQDQEKKEDPPNPGTGRKRKSLPTRQG